MFTDEFIYSITENPVEKIIEICKMTLGPVKQKGTTSITEKEYSNLLEGYSLIQSIYENNILEFTGKQLNLTGVIYSDSGQIIEYMQTTLKYFMSEATNLKLQSLTAKFKNKLASGFVYEFTQGDVDRIQTLLNELREEISKSSFIESEHKSRLLKRLENLQAEMHKRMSDLDKFWGLVGDAGVAIGKFGTDAKPFVDRIKEITDIIWRTQSKAEELPSSIQNPLIPHDSIV